MELGAFLIVSHFVLESCKKETQQGSQYSLVRSVKKTYSNTQSGKYDTYSFVQGVITISCVGLIRSSVLMQMGMKERR